MGARLVRDRIGDIPWKYGDDSKQGLRWVRGLNELNQLSLQKLLEECGEFLAAVANQELTEGTDASDSIEEAADILEVLIARIRVIFATPYPSRKEILNQIIVALDEKHEERGGFEKGVVWET